MNLAVKKFFRTEWFFVSIILLIILLVNIFPYWHGKIITPSNMVFLGEHYNIIDTSSYFTNMLQGKEHGLLIYDQYTTESQQPTFIFTFYVILGIISRFVNISIPVIFFISRIFFGLVLYILIYLFIRYFFDQVFWRKVTFLFIAFCSGLGWAYGSLSKPLLNGINLPVDLWLPDAVPTERLLSAPHVSAGHILLVLTLIFLIKLFRTNRLKFVFFAGGTIFLLSFVLPFETIVLDFTIIILGLIYIFMKIEPHFKIKALISILVLSSPSLLYIIYLTWAHPIWSKVEIQNLVPSPPIIFYMIGYGLLLLFGCFGLYLVLRKRNQHFFILCSWVIAVILLAYFPISIQRRFVETAFYIPLTILAVYSIKYLIQFKPKKIIYRFLIVIFILSSLSNIRMLNNITAFLNRLPLPYFIPRDDISALDWLSRNSDPDSIILSSFISGNVTPYFANRRVYIGHWTETLNLKEKMKLVDSFYNGEMDAETAKSFLRISNINYVLYLKIEQYQQFKEPMSYFFLKKVYDHDQTMIYKVITD